MFERKTPPDVLAKETPEISTQLFRQSWIFTRRNDLYFSGCGTKLWTLDDYGNLNPSHRQLPREAPHIGTSSGILNDWKCRTVGFLARCLLVESLLVNIEGKYVSGHMFFVDLKRLSLATHPEVIFYPLWVERRVTTEQMLGWWAFPPYLNPTLPVNTIWCNRQSNFAAWNQRPSQEYMSFSNDFQSENDVRFREASGVNYQPINCCWVRWP